jgi:hypothetical protein
MWAKGLGTTTTPSFVKFADRGLGARLGANEAQIYGAGPIRTYSFGDPRDPLTFVAKYFREFGAERVTSSMSPSASSSKA